jgi:hypothetical protein
LNPGTLRHPSSSSCSAFALDEVGVDEDEERLRIAPDRDIDDENPQRHPDLRRRQPDPRRGIHRFDHVVDEPLGVGRDRVNRLRAIVEDGVAVFENRSNHLSRGRTQNSQNTQRRATQESC